MTVGTTIARATPSVPPLTAARRATFSTRASLARAFNKDNDSTLAKFGVAAIEVLELPPEILDGDLCVTSESALLEGVEAVETVALMHTALPRDPDVITKMVERLTTEP